jgi:penicillin-binding protein 1A
MKNALEGKPVRTFNVPEGIVFAKIDAKTGLLPTEESEKTVFECFKEGTLPTDYTPKSDTASDTEELFKQGI